MNQQKAASFGLEGLLCRRAPGELASVPGFRECIWCFQLNMARHPGSSHSCTKIKRVSISPSLFCTQLTTTARRAI